MTEIFQTDILYERDARLLLEALKRAIPQVRFCFDLEDNAGILRAAKLNSDDDINKIINILSENGFICSLIAE